MYVCIIYVYISATSKGKHVCNYSKYPKTFHPWEVFLFRGYRTSPRRSPKAQQLQRGRPGAINMESGAALVGKPQKRKIGVSGHRTHSRSLVGPLYVWKSLRHTYMQVHSVCLEKGGWWLKVESSICVKIHGVSFFFGEVCACFRVLDVIEDVLIFACCFFRILAKSNFFPGLGRKHQLPEHTPQKNADEFPMLPLWIFIGSMGLVYFPTFWQKNLWVFMYTVTR